MYFKNDTQHIKNNKRFLKGDKNNFNNVPLSFFNNKLNQNLCNLHLKKFSHYFNLFLDGDFKINLKGIF